MKTITKILFVSIALLFVNQTFSQENTLEDKAATLTQNMQEQIGFSDEVAEKVYDINLEFVTKTDELKQSDTSKFKKFKSLKKLDENRDKALKDVLTKEEYETFKKNKSENRKTFKEKIKESRN